MHLTLSRLAFTEWQEVVTCERITKASFLSLAPPYPPFSSLFLILTLKRPLLSQSGPHLVTHAWKNKLNWNLSDSLFVFTPWIRLGRHAYVCIQSHDGKTFYGLEKLTEPNCFFVFVFKLGKVQSKRLNKEDLQSWWQDFDCLFCYLAVPVCHPQWGSLHWELECLCRPRECKLSICSRQGSKTKALGSGNCPQRLTRIVTGCPAPHLRGGRSVRIRAELCKHAHSPFLLPSAGLNANSKYLHRTVMENSNKYSAEIIQN